jgi:hypothetical protein
VSLYPEEEKGEMMDHEKMNEAQWLRHMADQQMRGGNADLLGGQAVGNWTPQMAEAFGSLPHGWGYTIRWGDQTFAIKGCESAEEAKAKCVKWVTDNGWTPPKWWQWWRWDDTRP